MSFAGGRLREIAPLGFIYEATETLPADVCQEAIRRFESQTEQQVAGRIGEGGQEAPAVKRSTDLRISGREDWRDIDQALARHLVSSVTALAGEVPFFVANAFKDVGYNLQRTLPGAFCHWHDDARPG